MEILMYSIALSPENDLKNVRSLLIINFSEMKSIMAMSSKSHNNRKFFRFHQISVAVKKYF